MAENEIAGFLILNIVGTLRATSLFVFRTTFFALPTKIRFLRKKKRLHFHKIVVFLQRIFLEINLI